MTQQKTPTQMEQEMNADIFRRNVPSSSLQPYLSVRPASTKYSIMPVVDPRRQLHVPLRVDPTYNMAHTFNPGNATAPWSGYASKVNVESELKNQIFALQHCGRNTYVPQSTSDLYMTPAPINTNPQVMNHPLLFEQPTFSECPRVPEYMHQTLFNTPTREETRMAGIKE
tara:strand:+ start:5028 stop:5537 length:510 start_codon:yes stop_codon:yes gene_type:complete